MYFPDTNQSLDQGSQTLVLEGRCPAGFGCFPASTHLIQIKWISSEDFVTFCTNQLMRHQSESGVLEQGII